MRFAYGFLLLPALLMPLGSVAAAQAFGPVGDGAAGAQVWRIPSQDPARPALALLYRPAGAGPFRLAVVAHASTQNTLRRIQMPQPDYHALAALLLARGFAVLVPERLGHGATGGAYLEDQGGCEDADYLNSGRATAEQIWRALAFMRDQDFVRKEGAVIIGHSAGGWGALALAGQDPKSLAAIVVVAPGRGGHADDVAGRFCSPERLVEAAREFGRRARVPVSWLVAANDSYFPPAFSARLAKAFKDGGGKVTFSILPASGEDGHWLVEHEDGVSLAAYALDRALKTGTAGRATMAKPR